MNLSLKYAYPVSEIDRIAIMLLYQPIIKKDAVNVYLTLSSLYQSGIKTPLLSDLYDLCGMNPESFTEAINKCESAFLIAFDEKKMAVTLHPVLSFEAFFKSPLLPHLKMHVSSEYLSQIKLKQSPPSNVMMPKSELFKEGLGKIQEMPSLFDNVQSTVDVVGIVEGLPKALIERYPRIEELKRMMHHVAYLYDLDALKMNELMIIFLKQDLLTFEILSDLAQKHFSGNSPKKTFDVAYFKKVHPKELLKDLTGSHVPSSDIKTVDMLIQNSGLKLEVINVMMAYVLSELSGQMPVYKYFEKVSGQWHRNHIQTAEEAVAHIKTIKQKPKKAQAKKGSEIAWFDDYLKTKEAK